MLPIIIIVLNLKYINKKIIKKCGKVCAKGGRPILRASPNGVGYNRGLNWTDKILCKLVRYCASIILAILVCYDLKIVCY